MWVRVLAASGRAGMCSFSCPTRPPPLSGSSPSCGEGTPLRGAHVLLQLGCTPRCLHSPHASFSSGDQFLRGAPHPPPGGRARTQHLPGLWRRPGRRSGAGTARPPPAPPGPPCAGPSRRAAGDRGRGGVSAGRQGGPRASSWNPAAHPTVWEISAQPRHSSTSQSGETQLRSPSSQR